MQGTGKTTAMLERMIDAKQSDVVIVVANSNEVHRIQGMLKELLDSRGIEHVQRNWAVIVFGSRRATFQTVYRSMRGDRRPVYTDHHATDELRQGVFHRRWSGDERGSDEERTDADDERAEDGDLRGGGPQADRPVDRRDAEVQRGAAD